MRRGQVREGMRVQARRSGYVASIVVNVVLLFVFSNLLSWGVPFLTEEFTAPLLFFNLSFVAAIVGNILTLFYDANWFRHLVRIIVNVIGAAAIYVLLIVFPFAFPAGPWDLVGRIVLAMILVGIGIGTIVEAVRLFFGGD